VRKEPSLPSWRRKRTSRLDPHKPLWYRRYRGAAYLATLAALVWTVVIVLPIKPFSYLPPIIAGGGPGTWFFMAYLLFLSIGVGGFGGLSSFAYTTEVQEGRLIDSKYMSVGLALVGFGLSATCILLAIAGALGGYVLTINGASETMVQNLLSPYVYPVTTSTLLAVLGAVLAISALVRARRPSP